MHYGEECCFEPPDQEAVDGELGIPVDAELQEGEDTPGNVKERNEPMERDVCEQEEEGDLPGNGTDDVERLKLHELVALETKFLFETGDIGIIWIQ